MDIRNLFQINLRQVIGLSNLGVEWHFGVTLDVLDLNRCVSFFVDIFNRLLLIANNIMDLKFEMRAFMFDAVEIFRLNFFVPKNPASSHAADGTTLVCVGFRFFNWTLHLDLLDCCLAKYN